MRYREKRRSEHSRKRVKISYGSSDSEKAVINDSENYLFFRPHVIAYPAALDRECLPAPRIHIGTWYSVLQNRSLNSILNYIR